MTALAELREAPGLDAYLAELEDRLDHAVGTYRGIVALHTAVAKTERLGSDPGRSGQGQAP